MKSRRNLWLGLLLLLLLALLLARCQCKPDQPVTQPPTPTPTEREAKPAENAPGGELPPEVLSEATLSAPARVQAGAKVAVAWTGPANRGDHLLVVPANAPDAAVGAYELVGEEPTLELTAPMEPGPCEIRYVTGRSHTVLGRAAVEVLPTSVTLQAADEVTLGSHISVTWTGPNNTGDYITLVAKDAPEGHFVNYTTTDRGSPLEVLAPAEAGEGELRYMSGQGRHVLGRRDVRIVQPQVSLSAPGEAIAGATLEVEWKGPDNAGDYVTVVAKGTPDGQYGNYVGTAAGSPARLLLPILTGDAELRYMTGQGGKVLARRALLLRAAEVALEAPGEAAAGSEIRIEWTGPSHGGDYITVVEKGAADGRFGHYRNTSEGSPLVVKAPDEPGEAEVRYMTGQGGKVLARRPIRILR
jgi:Ca-activated chloride channel family protein